MNKTELKPGIFIERFDSFEETQECRINMQREKNNYSIILYQGKTSEIPEGLAKEYVDIDYFGEYFQGMWQYQGYRNFDINTPYDHVHTAKQSIHSACDKEYCIIYKTN